MDKYRNASVKNVQVSQSQISPALNISSNLTVRYDYIQMYLVCTIGTANQYKNTCI